MIVEVRTEVRSKPLPAEAITSDNSMLRLLFVFLADCNIKLHPS